MLVNYFDVEDAHELSYPVLGLSFYRGVGVSLFLALSTTYDSGIAKHVPSMRRRRAVMIYLLSCRCELVYFSGRYVLPIVLILKIRPFIFACLVCQYHRHIARVSI